jgi:probable rRNA maturation factor
MNGERAARQPLVLELVRSRGAWSPARAELARWASAALGRRGGGAAVCVRVVAPRESRRLNRRFRGRNRPTNVLSFPAPSLLAGDGPRPLGDLAICGRVLRDEARAQRKPLRAHWAHIVVHGVLHLAGFDHVRQRDAERMERREIAILRSLGLANPYRSRELR